MHLPGFNTDRAVSYALDANGNRTKLTWPGDFLNSGGQAYFASYCYDNLNRMTVVMGNASDPNCATNLLAQYSYNSLSRRYHLAYSGSSGATIGTIYSPAGDLLNLDHNLAAQADSPHYVFTYTDAHEVQTEGNNRSAYVWQPSATGTTGYAAANSLNQYPSYTPSSGIVNPRLLGYDLKGNLTSGNLDGSGIWAFGYDAENRMTSACKPAVSGVCASPTVNASYLYDPLGRRVEKSGAGVTKTWFLNDGDDEIAEYDSNKNPSAIYIPGPAIDEPIAMVTGFGGTLTHAYFHTNHQGSVIAMSDDGGNKIEGPYTYDPYGNCFSGATPCAQIASSEPFKFTGRRLDPETGLYFYRARYYWTNGGRFLQTDPVGYTADLNLYTYVGNDPVGKTDPTGKAQACANDPDNCIESSTFNEKTNKVPNVTLSPKDKETTLTHANEFKGTEANMKFVVGDKMVEASDTRTGTVQNAAESAEGTPPAGATAVEHGHPTAGPHQTEGLIDEPKSLGDTQSITRGMPNVAVNGNRVDVHEAPGGHLRMRMLKGRMTRREREVMGPRLDQRQEAIQQFFENLSQGPNK